MWTGLVLAGGSSTRMRRDKASLPLLGRTLLERAVAVVRQAGGEPIVVAAAGPGRDLPGVRRVDDTAAGGPAVPLAALRCGLAACGAPAVALACDLPLVPPGLLAALAASLAGRDAVVPRAGGVLQVLAAAYAPSCLPAIDARLRRGDLSVHGFLKELRVLYLEDAALEAHGGESIFLNVNTPDDLREAERRLGRAPA